MAGGEFGRYISGQCLEINIPCKKHMKCVNCPILKAFLFEKMGLFFKKLRHADPENMGLVCHNAMSLNVGHGQPKQPRFV